VIHDQTNGCADLCSCCCNKEHFCFEVTGAFSAILLVRYLMDQASKLLLVKLILVMSSCILMHSEAACLLDEGFFLGAQFLISLVN
jgi:hypothetical protein